MINYKLNNDNTYYQLTCVEYFQKFAKNHLIEYTNKFHSKNHGFVSNILYKEMNDLIDNIRNVTDNKMYIKDNYIYIIKEHDTNFNIDNTFYPDPVKNAFNNCVNYFLKLQNI